MFRAQVGDAGMRVGVDQLGRAAREDEARQRVGQRGLEPGVVLARGRAAVQVRPGQEIPAGAAV